MAELDPEVVLTQLKTHLEANPTIQSYSVDGVTVSRASLMELLKARAELRSEANSNNAAKSQINYFRRGPV